MSFDVLARDMFETLSAEQKAEVVDFIFFLSTRQKRAEDSQRSVRVLSLLIASQAV